MNFMYHNMSYRHEGKPTDIQTWRKTHWHPDMEENPLTSRHEGKPTDIQTWRKTHWHPDIFDQSLYWVHCLCTAGVLTLFQHASYLLCDQVKAIDRRGVGGASESVLTCRARAEKSCWRGGGWGGVLVTFSLSRCAQTGVGALRRTRRRAEDC